MVFFLKKKKRTEVKNKRAKKRNKPGKIWRAGRGQEWRGGRASVRRALGVQRRQRGRKHQHFGLHEGQIGQPGNHFRRLLAQVFVSPGFPVQTGSDKRASEHRNQQKQEKTFDLFHLDKQCFVEASQGGWGVLTWWRCWSCPWWTWAGRRRRPRGCWSWTRPAWLWLARTARGQLLTGTGNSQAFIVESTGSVDSSQRWNLRPSLWPPEAFQGWTQKISIRQLSRKRDLWPLQWKSPEWADYLLRNAHLWALIDIYGNSGEAPPPVAVTGYCTFNSWN